MVLILVLILVLTFYVLLLVLLLSLQVTLRASGHVHAVQAVQQQDFTRSDQPATASASQVKRTWIKHFAADPTTGSCQVHLGQVKLSEDPFIAAAFSTRSPAAAWVSIEISASLGLLLLIQPVRL